MQAKFILREVDVVQPLLFSLRIFLTDAAQSVVAGANGMGDAAGRSPFPVEKVLLTSCPNILAEEIQTSTIKHAAGSK